MLRFINIISVLGVMWINVHFCFIFLLWIYWTLQNKERQIIEYSPLCSVSSPWEVTSEERCHQVCPLNAYCSQLVPLLHYECVCKPGYEGDGVRTCSGNQEDNHSKWWTLFLFWKNIYIKWLNDATLGANFALYNIFNFCTDQNSYNKVEFLFIIFISL